MERISHCRSPPGLVGGDGTIGTVVLLNTVLLIMSRVYWGWVMFDDGLAVAEPFGCLGFRRSMKPTCAVLITKEVKEKCGTSKRFSRSVRETAWQVRTQRRSSIAK